MSACNAGDPSSIPWSGKIPWRWKWQPTPVLLPGKSHGLRSLVGYSPWGRKELDTTEWLHFHFHFQYTVDANVCVLSCFSHVQFFWDPMDCSPPCSSVCEILQARILKWVAMPSSRGSSWPRDQTHISCGSCIAGRFFTTEPPGEP